MNRFLSMGSAVFHVSGHSVLAFLRNENPQGVAAFVFLKCQPVGRRKAPLISEQRAQAYPSGGAGKGSSAARTAAMDESMRTIESMVLVFMSL